MRIFGFEICRYNNYIPITSTIGWEAFNVQEKRVKLLEVALLTNAGWTRDGGNDGWWFAPKNANLDGPLTQTEAMSVQSARMPT